MKTMSIWVASATLFLASMGICSCSMGSTTSSEMRGSLEFTQDDLREKPFKAIDVDMVASVYYTQNDGDECSVRLDYSAIKDAEFVQKLKEKIKVVYRDGEVKIGLTGRGHCSFGDCIIMWMGFMLWGTVFPGFFWYRMRCWRIPS